MKLSTHLHLVSKLQMHGAILPPMILCLIKHRDYFRYNQKHYFLQHSNSDVINATAYLEHILDFPTKSVISL
jgi:hypothetical protein